MSGCLPIMPLAGDFPQSGVAGKPGALKNIAIRDLRVDPEYQRAISTGSVRNIRRICKNFDWSKFLPVIVVESSTGIYEVIDGQHRTTAAATLGITHVPCYILECSQAEAAAAFAAINGNVTPVGPVDIWFAEVLAKSPDALALQAVLDAAEVRVTRKKEGLRAGETRSINVLRRALDKYGADLLTTVLQCITQTSDGNPGMITGAVVNAIGMAIRTKHLLLENPSELFDQFDRIDLSELERLARIEVARTGNALQFVMTREINLRINNKRVAA